MHLTSALLQCFWGDPDPFDPYFKRESGVKLNHIFGVGYLWYSIECHNHFSSFMQRQVCVFPRSLAVTRNENSDSTTWQSLVALWLTNHQLKAPRLHLIVTKCPSGTHALRRDYLILREHALQLFLWWSRYVFIVRALRIAKSFLPSYVSIVSW